MHRRPVHSHFNISKTGEDQCLIHGPQRRGTSSSKCHPLNGAQLSVELLAIRAIEISHVSATVPFQRSVRSRAQRRGQGLFFRIGTLLVRRGLQLWGSRRVNAEALTDEERSRPTSSLLPIHVILESEVGADLVLGVELWVRCVKVFRGGAARREGEVLFEIGGSVLVVIFHDLQDSNFSIRGFSTF